MVSIAQRDYGRILMIMPKKFGNAPKRNKLKRQLRSLSIKNKWYEVKSLVQDKVFVPDPTAVSDKNNFKAGLRNIESLHLI